MRAERCIVMVNLSVRLSVRHTLILYRNLGMHIFVELFSPSGRGTTRVFVYYRRYEITMETPTRG